MAQGGKTTWRPALIAAFRSQGSLTATEIGKIVGCYGPDAVTRARLSGLHIVITGKAPRKYSKGPAPRLYALSDEL